MLHQSCFALFRADTGFARRCSDRHRSRHCASKPVSGVYAEPGRLQLAATNRRAVRWAGLCPVPWAVDHARRILQAEPSHSRRCSRPRRGGAFWTWCVRETCDTHTQAGAQYDGIVVSGSRRATNGTVWTVEVITDWQFIRDRDSARQHLARFLTQREYLLRSAILTETMLS